VNEANGERIVHEKDVPFYKKQMRLIFGMNGEVDPTCIDDYLAAGGYKGLVKALTTMKPPRSSTKSRRPT